MQAQYKCHRYVLVSRSEDELNMKRIYHLVRFPAFLHEFYDKHINCLHILWAQEMNIKLSSDILIALLSAIT